MAVATVDQLRVYLNQVPTGATTDEQLQAVIDRADQIVVEALGFAFFDAGDTWADVSATTKRVRAESSVYLKLPPYSYGSITSVAVVTGAGDTADTGDPVTDYDETQERFYLYRPAGWWGGRYAVTAKYGYGPAPESVVEMVLELAVNIWRQKAQGMFQTLVGVDSGGQSTGGGSIKYVGGLNRDQRAVLAGVRRRFVEAVY